MNERRGPGGDDPFDELLRSALEAPEPTSQQLAAFKAAAMEAAGRPLVRPRAWLWLFPAASLGLSGTAVFLLVRLGLPLSSLAAATGAIFGALFTLPAAVGGSVLLPLVLAVCILDFGLLRWISREGVR